VSARLCRFCNEYEVPHPDDDRCINCAYFGPGDPHGVKYYVEQRRRERQQQDQVKLEQGLVERVREAAREVLDE
jgi:hypothetical protein